jgi:hypothetical protein
MALQRRCTKCPLQWHYDSNGITRAFYEFCNAIANAVSVKWHYDGISRNALRNSIIMQMALQGRFAHARSFTMPV